MNCSVCNRNNAVTLSICPSCGSMIRDSVREELVPKISGSGKLVKAEVKEHIIMPIKFVESAKTPAPPKPAVAPQTATTEISAKTTSPTLVEFHSKNATLPEWRLQLQNVVRQRHETSLAAAQTITQTATPPVQRTRLVTNGATALKAQPFAQAGTVPHKNPTLSSALERIEKSRRQFLKEAELPEPSPVVSTAKAGKNYALHIAPKTGGAETKSAEINSPVGSFAKPKLVSSLRTESEKFDTDKLPPLPKPAQVATSFESRVTILDELKPTLEEVFETKINVADAAKTKTAPTETAGTPEVEEVEEFDDCASFAMRFNAGLFDLIIGTFLSLFLLAPFMLLGGNWFSVAGMFAFLATCSLVMFIYMTTAIGFYGRTFGMRLFSLEIVDIESEDYPTFHQAAVSSAVYLLSLALGGIGFLTLPFNEDKRAVHDLVSGTVMIKE
ncbi:MAG: RDD family protein [Pyrinomonadaceae bacterium]|nr:RDD family protein [Pyrinomonadaceae bacterium]